MGNRLNFGTTIGAAVGFELTVLTKLSDVKSNEGNYTLLNYLVQTIERKLPELLDFEKEIQHVDDAACLTEDAIQDKLNNIITSSESLQNTLNEANVLHDNLFIEIMSPFSLETRKKVKVLKEQMKRLKDHYKKVGEYYAFNISKCSMKDFFSTIKIFKNSFNKARTKNIRAALEKDRTVQQQQVHAGIFVINS